MSKDLTINIERTTTQESTGSPNDFYVHVNVTLTGILSTRDKKKFLANLSSTMRDEMHNACTIAAETFVDSQMTIHVNEPKELDYGTPDNEHA